MSIIKPPITTLQHIAYGGFDDDTATVLKIVERLKIPIRVVQMATDGYYDINIGDIINIEAMSAYHLKGYTEKTLPQIDLESIEFRCGVSVFPPQSHS